ncbi:HAD-IIB family hydrolase [Shewanella dokdonensis]|nr:HAD-IIB family hydrolase [Shewanella dokdonensis]MCL1075435.1 HAD family hydrolase [Shewanella dokdonensis]
MKVALNNKLNIVFDLDGTVIKNGVKMHDTISDYILNLSTYFNVFFASARPVRDMLPLIPNTLHNTILVGCNGGQAWYNGKIIISNHFKNDDVNKILELLNHIDMSYVLDTDWNYSFSTKAHEFHDYIRQLSLGEIEEREAIKLGITKILILDGKYSNLIKEHLENNKILNEINFHKNEGIFDITPQHTDKENTLKLLGIDFNHTISLGNDKNDFKMLGSSSISLFVGDKKDYSHATYYCDMDTLLPTLNRAIKNFGINYNG